MEWPSLIRREIRLDEAAKITAAIGEDSGQAYLHVAWLFECEFCDGPPVLGAGYSDSMKACEVLLASLRREAGLEQAA